MCEVWFRRLMEKDVKKLIKKKPFPELVDVNMYKNPP
jgi:hypothetical protein